MRPLIFFLALTLPVGAAPLLDMPAPATEIGGRGESPSSLRLPEGPFAEGLIPLREAEGTVDQRAYRLSGRLTTLQLFQPLAAQVEAQGFKTVFTCEADACGGFDFRYGMAVLPEPQMHVDLGDYRYLLAERQGASGEDLIALLVSRTADQGFVQVSSVTTLGAAERAALRTGAVKAAETPVAAAEPSVAQTVAPSVEQPPPGDLDAAFRTTGAAVLEGLVFASGSGALEPQDYPALTALAAWLVAHPDRKVTLVGHTDASGALAANLALSKKRAQSVRAALVALGAGAGQIDAQGAGYLAPVADNDTPEGRAKNRRVEVMLTPAL